jgi:hypothetical protein
MRTQALMRRTISDTRRYIGPYLPVLLAFIATYKFSLFFVFAQAIVFILVR